MWLSINTKLLFKTKHGLPMKSYCTGSPIVKSMFVIFCFCTRYCWPRIEWPKSKEHHPTNGTRCSWIDRKTLIFCCFLRAYWSKESKKIVNEVILAIHDIKVDITAEKSKQGENSIDYCPDDEADEKICELLSVNQSQRCMARTKIILTTQLVIKYNIRIKAV